MQIGSGDVFVRRSGDTMTGPLTISANVSDAILVNRPDGNQISPLRVQTGGGDRWRLTVGTGPQLFRILNSAAADMITLNDTTFAIGTAIAPLAVIGDSGSVAANSILAGQNGSVTIGPSGMTGKTICLANVRNSVSTLNNGGTLSPNVNQTDLRGWGIYFNTDSTIGYQASSGGAGSITLTGKNTNAGTANLTFDWVAIGR